jgi:hypothetical protein
MEPWMERVVDLFLAGRLPKMNHARHFAVARILKTMPLGRELMHLGLQVTATRAGVPEKYSAAVTDRYWDALEPAKAEAHDFADVVSWASLSAAVEASCPTTAATGTCDGLDLTGDP